jgi:hypothetical protein
VAALVAGEDDEAGSELFEIPMDVDCLAPPVNKGWVGGISRIAPAAGELVVSVDDLGQRWSRVRSGGAPTSSEPCGRPLSVSEAEPVEGGLRLEALSRWPDEAPSILQVTLLDDGTIDCRADVVEGATITDPEPRRVVLADGTSVVVHVSAGQVRVERLAGNVVIASIDAGLSATRIADARLIGSTGVVLHLDGPPALAVLHFDEGSLVAAAVPLSYAPGPTDERLGRSIAVVRDRVFVAGRDGLEAFEAHADDDSDAIVLGSVALPPEAVSLRAPIAVVPLPEP